MASNLDDSEKSLNKLEPSFMYTQIFKDIVLTMKDDPEDIKKLAKFCREQYKDNADEIKIIDRFEREYKSSTAIFWYTYECFTYKMLNRALRLLDGGVLIKMNFFLRDLHRQLYELYQQQLNDFDGKPLY